MSSLIGILIFISSHLYGQDSKPAVFVFTDINLAGGDPDDRQSLIHLLWYANDLDIKGIVPDRWQGGGYDACMLALETYRKDYHRFKFSDHGYPSPDGIKSVIAQHEKQAINQFVDVAETVTAPLYVLVWGNMLTVKKILFAHPHLGKKLRILSIGTGRKYGPKDEVPGEDCDVPNWNGRGRNDIYFDSRFDKLWWLENNWTYNGMFMGDGPKMMFEKLAIYGDMGMHIKDVTKAHEWAQYFRVGDTPSVLYLIDPDHNPEDPTISSWAGKFYAPFPDRKPNYYTDDHGDIEWNYQDPCGTWSNLEKMYAYNKQTLLVERAEMYQALLNKLDLLYRH